MQLKVKERKVLSKSSVKSLRREGLIPAVIYHKSKPAETVMIDSAEFSSLLRAVPPGRLSTRQFILEAENGAKRKAILKDIQYHPVSYNVIHLDFEELIEGLPVNIKVPVECVGVVDCVGIKLGGFLRQVLRSIRVNCLPKDIPEFFTINITEMNIRDHKKIKDLAIPETVRPLVNTNEVIVVIAKR